MYSAVVCCKVRLNKNLIKDFTEIMMFLDDRQVSWCPRVILTPAASLKEVPAALILSQIPV